MRELKERLLAQCIAQQESVIQQLEKEIQEAQQQANDYGQPKDRYDAYRNKLMRQIELYAGQLDKAKVVLNTLHQLPVEKDFTVVEYGALIRTNRQNLFLSAGLGKIELEGEDYFAISATVPIAIALSGKKKGDKVTFNNNSFEILEIS